MRLQKIESLTLETFRPFGSFSNVINPNGIKIGEKPIEFFRDMELLNLGQSFAASFSICRVEKRDFIIDLVEYHTNCGEGILPLDGDILIHVGHSTPNNKVPVEDIKVFIIPKGTLVTIKPGVWHHAPFAYKYEYVNTLIVLPERTYANDCKVIELKGEERIKICDE